MYISLKKVLFVYVLTDTLELCYFFSLSAMFLRPILVVFCAVYQLGVLLVMLPKADLSGVMAAIDWLIHVIPKLLSVFLLNC